MKDASMFRLELRIALVPLERGDVERAAVCMRQAVSVIGTVAHDADVQPYAKPAGASMVRIEADCVGDHRSIVEKVVEAVGGTGWIWSGSGEEVEAIWSPQEGAVPPVSVFATWC